MCSVGEFALGVIDRLVFDDDITNETHRTILLRRCGYSLIAATVVELVIGGVSFYYASQGSESMAPSLILGVTSVALSIISLIGARYLFGMVASVHLSATAHQLEESRKQIQGDVDTLKERIQTYVTEAGELKSDAAERKQEAEELRGHIRTLQDHAGKMTSLLTQADPEICKSERMFEQHLRMLHKMILDLTTPSTVRAAALAQSRTNISEQQKYVEEKKRVNSKK